MTDRPVTEASARRPTLAPPLAASRPTAMQQLAALLEAPDAGEQVQRLPSVQLNRLVSHIGLADAGELLALASAEQLRELVDLQIWTDDVVDADELLDWTHALLHANPDGLRALDVELLSLVLLQNARIYLLEEQQVPDPPEGTLFGTPDRWFAIDVVADEARVPQVAELIEALYINDPEEARRLLQNLLWELPSQLQEEAFRWRSGRLEDLGFADPLSALRVYAYLDPRSVDPEQDRSADRPLAADPEPAAAGGEIAATVGAAGSFWNRALERLAEDERQRVGKATLAVANQTLSADRVASSEAELAEESLEALHCRLSLGLEHLCAGDLERATGVLASVAVQRIARVGHSLALDLRRALLALTRQRRLGRSPGGLDLLERERADRLRPLLGQRPLFFDEELERPRPFHDPQDLEAACGWIRDATRAAALVPSELWPQPLPDGLTLGELYCTTVANRLLGREDARPIDDAALATLLGKHVLDGVLGPAWHQRALALAAERLATDRLATDDPGAGTDEATTAVVEGWLSALGEQIGTLRPGDLDLRFVAGLHLERV